MANFFIPPAGHDQLPAMGQLGGGDGLDDNLRSDFHPTPPTIFDPTQYLGKTAQLYRPLATPGLGIFLFFIMVLTGRNICVSIILLSAESSQQSVADDYNSCSFWSRQK